MRKRLSGRGPLGKVLRRQLKSNQYTTSLPGAPDAQYVVIQFNTSFENKKAAIETITPMRDEDGLWWVSGYDIRWRWDPFWQYRSSNRHCTMEVS